MLIVFLRPILANLGATVNPYCERAMKVGDKVICINASNSSMLKEGNIDTITEISDRMIYLKQWPGYSWFKSRFEIDSSNSSDSCDNSGQSWRDRDPLL